jgi:hypothetical protein
LDEKKENMGLMSMTTELAEKFARSRENRGEEANTSLRAEVATLLKEISKSIAPQIQTMRDSGWEAVRPTSEGFALLRSQDPSAVELSALRDPSCLQEAIKITCDDKGIPLVAEYLEDGYFTKVSLVKNCGDHQVRVLLAKLKTFKAAQAISHR